MLVQDFLSSRWEVAVRYLVLIYSNPESRQLWESFSDAERDAGLGAYAALTEALAASGELVVAERLADPATARRVVVRDGEVMATDGPFAEAKEQLAGFYLLECASFDQAVARAARIPEAALGLVEVRPVMTLRGPQP